RFQLHPVDEAGPFAAVIASSTSSRILLVTHEPKRKSDQFVDTQPHHANLGNGTADFGRHRICDVAVAWIDGSSLSGLESQARSGLGGLEQTAFHLQQDECI